MEVDPAVPLTLNSDRARLQQILNNLLTNALKFTEKGQVELTASLLPADQDGRQMLQLQVRDSGIGIARISRSAFSRPSSRSMVRSVGITAAPAWGWRSRGNWWKCWAAR